MYTPITKRVKVAQHKSSIAKLTEDEKKKTEKTADSSGKLQDTTGIGTGSTYTPPVAYEGKDACEDPNSAACKKWTSENERCKDPNAEGCSGFKKYETGTTTPGNADFESKPVMQDAQAASRIDLMGPQELRGNTRAGKIAIRNVKKADKQLKRMQKKFKAGKIGKEVLKAYEDELANTVSRSENIGQQAKGMRNRYLSQTMDYDRDLTKGREAGPVKAPEGTQTEDEFKSRFKKELGVSSDSTAPQTTTTPTSSFSEMASQNGVSYKPITLDNAALFQGLDSSISDFGNKVKKGGVGKMKSGAFKMKGYGSKK